MNTDRAKCMKRTKCAWMPIVSLMCEPPKEADKGVKMYSEKEKLFKGRLV